MPKGKPSSMLKCCTCNGQAAKCRGCRCAREKRKCTNCLAPECTNKMGPPLATTSPSDTSIPQTSTPQVPVEANSEADGMPCLLRLSMADIYDTVIHWKPNLLMLPRCTASNTVIDILADYYRSAVSDVSTDNMALKSATVFAHCVMQRPPSLKITIIRKVLERRIKLWQDGMIHEVFEEARILQHRCVNSGHKSSKPDWIKLYCRLIKSGKLSASTSVLEDKHCMGVLQSNSVCGGITVKDHLEGLHPPPADVQLSVLLQENIPEASEHHPSLFLDIDGDAIVRAAKKTHGGAGPSGLDSISWRRMLTLFAGHSRNLADALAEFAIQLATERLPAQRLEAFVACRLVAVGKKDGGIRPIGVADVSRRIVCKAILINIRNDLQDVADITQLCASQRSGLEFAIHSLRDAFSADSNSGLLAVDAKNAFNCINRKVALHNIQFICPAMSCILSNLYSSEPCLIFGDDTLSSREGLTQGDPLAMAAFAMASMPLIRQIRQMVPNVLQRWYADDANFVGTPCDLQRVWMFLRDVGPRYGYFVNADKTQLLLHQPHSEQLDMTRDVHVNYDGIDVLGTSIGTDEFVSVSSNGKIMKWIEMLERLEQVAEHDPHAAYAGLVHSVQWKWTHFLRTTKCSDQQLMTLRNAIVVRLLPLILKHVITDALTTALTSPLRLGGMGIVDPVFIAEIEYANSQTFCQTYSSCLRGRALRESQNSITVLLSGRRHHLYKQRLDEASHLLSGSTLLSLEHARVDSASSWLSAIPLSCEDYHLSSTEFTDSIATRYGWTPNDRVNRLCVCGSVADLTHVLSCKKGGLLIVRHNAVRDVIAKELSQVCHGVETEPVLRAIGSRTCFESATTCCDPDARLDVVCSGLFESRFVRTFLDVAVFNAHASSYSQSAAASFRYHENRKRAKYDERVTNVEGGTFFPVIFSSAGGAGPAASRLLKTIAEKAASHSQMTYSERICKLKRRIAFCLCRASSACIRCARSTRSAPMASF